MLFPSDPCRHRVGVLMVVLQFGLLALLAALALPRVMQGRVPPVVGWVLLLAIALAVWTLAHNRLGNFNIHPSPKAQGMLVTSGPYRLIRHPMYSAVLLVAVALIFLLGDPVVAWLVWGALAVVLWLKASLEERWLSERYPTYADYCTKSKRFVPWLL